MTSMKTRGKYPFDREPSVTLQATGTAAVEATENGAAVSLETLTEAYWDDNEIPLQGFVVVVNVSAIDFSTNETYVLDIQADTTSGFASAIVVGSLTITSAGGIGAYTILLDGDTISKLEPGATHLRYAATLGGTTPSITFNAFLTLPVH